MTYADLKAKLDTLTPEQLAMTVRWWGDERGGEICRIDVLDEPWVSIDGEGCEPASSYPDGVDDADVVLCKGTPILMVDE